MPASNVICGVASFFFPGLGQLCQGRIWPAIKMFLLTLLFWVLTFGLLGWVGHVIAAYEAAVWRESKAE